MLQKRNSQAPIDYRCSNRAPAGSAIPPFFIFFWCLSSPARSSCLWLKERDDDDNVVVPVTDVTTDCGGFWWRLSPPPKLPQPRPPLSLYATKAIATTVTTKTTPRMEVIAALLF